MIHINVEWITLTPTLYPSVCTIPQLRRKRELTNFCCSCGYTNSGLGITPLDSPVSRLKWLQNLLAARSSLEWKSNFATQKAKKETMFRFVSQYLTTSPASVFVGNACVYCVYARFRTCCWLSWRPYSPTTIEVEQLHALQLRMWESSALWESAD